MGILDTARLDRCPHWSFTTVRALGLSGGKALFAGLILDGR